MRRSRKRRRQEAERLAVATPQAARTTYASLIAERRKKRKGTAHEVPGGLPGSKR
jgi:hypothetical protein